MRGDWDFWGVALLAAFLVACSVDAHDVRPASETPVPETSLQVRGVRRLSEPEYRATLATLLGNAALPELPLPPTARQRGFSRNAAQVLDSHSAAALHAFVTEAARAAVRAASVRELSLLASCDGDALGECGRRFVDAFGRRAFRRPLTGDEIARYAALFDAGREGAAALDGAALVIATMLESPFAVYAQALGDEPAGASSARLTGHEIASELSYAITAAPPDAELDSLGDGTALFEPKVRGREARRLFEKSETRFQYRRFVDEWLELDRLFETAKDFREYPDFSASRPALRDEAWAFVDRAMIEANGAFAALVTSPAGERTGVLELPAFLAVHAHPASSAPVLRGVAVLERVLCRDFPTPDELGISVTPPPPDPDATTRELFEAHASDPACSGCHSEIDPVGGTFEGFDAAGAARGEDAGKPVNTGGSVTLDGRAVALANSAELARALAVSEDAERCFARQVFRYLGGRDDTQAEEAFVTEARELPRSKRASLVELSVAYVASERFVRRRGEP